MPKKKTQKKTIKAWITVSDYAKAPTTYGEYFTRKKPKHYGNRLVNCEITYKL